MMLRLDLVGPQRDDLTRSDRAAAVFRNLVQTAGSLGYLSSLLFSF